MTTLYDALLETAEVCGITSAGKTTAVGSDSYLTDITRHENDDYYNNGTLFVRTGDNADNSRRITDYTQASGKVTFTPVLSEPMRADVYYTITNGNREKLTQAVNTALRQMGKHAGVDESLVVLADTTEYTLPTGVFEVTRIEAYIDTSAPHVLSVLPNWREEDGVIYLPKEISETVGNTIRIHYNTYHDRVNEDTDVIQDEYPLERLMWAAAYFYLLGRYQYSGNTDDRETYLLENAKQNMQIMSRSYPVRRRHRDPVLGYE